jgi:RHS repeat-associated protein
LQLLKRVSVCTVLLSAFFSLPVRAADVVWDMQAGGSFPQTTTSDDVNITGTFTFDASSDVVSTWSITITGGAAPLNAFTYDPTTSDVSVGVFPGQSVVKFTCKVSVCPLLNGSPRVLRIGPFAAGVLGSTTPTPLDDAGGVRRLLPDPVGNRETYDVSARTIDGYIIGTPAVAPPPPPPVFGEPGTTTTPGSPSPTTTTVTKAISDTVNTGSGDRYIRINDVVTPGAGLHFVFTRSYNGLDPYSGPLCNGWTHSYNILLTINSDTGAITIKEGDGHENTFQPGAGGTFTAPPGDFDVLTQSGSDYFLTRPDQTVYKFSTLSISPLIIRLVSITDKNGNQQSLAYDAAGNLITFTDIGGGTFSFTYDGSNHLLTLHDNQLNRTFSYECDAAPQLTSFTDAASQETNYTYGSNGKLTVSIDPLTQTQVSSNYDAFNRVTQTTRTLTSGACITSFSYNDAAHVTTITDPRGAVTQHFYDSTGRLIKVVNALTFETTYTYDSNNNILTTTNPLGATTTYSYDSHGNRTSIVDALGRTTTMLYDSKNNMTSMTDANSNTTLFAYDANGNLTQVTDALGGVTAYQYTGSNKTKIINAKGAQTVNTYGIANRLLNSTDPALNVTTYSYDAGGRLSIQIEPAGNQKMLAYDNLGHLTSVTYPAAGTLAASGPVSYTYDANGNRLTMADSTGVTSYVYDSLNRITQITFPGSRVVSYTYDCNNNRTSISFAGKTINYTYDLLNRLTDVADGASLTHYTYDAADNLLSIAYPNGSGVTYTYDLASRITKVGNFYVNGVGNTISSFQYSLDNVGNRTQVNGATLVYDKLNRLVSAGFGNSLAYDAVGNRTAELAPSVSVGHVYDIADRLLSRGPTSYTFDKNGNLTSLKKNNKTTNYIFDAANRLISVTGGGVNSTFTYDGDGNRVAQKVGSSPAYTYLNDIATGFATVLDENGPDGHIQYVRGRGLISASSPAFTYFYHYDAQSTVAGLTDSLGKVVKRYDYDVWGVPTGAVPSNKVGTQNKWSYTGEALDPGTNLIYLRARYYDPTIGRFISRDPFGGYERVPITANRFIYTRDNPATLTDRTGLYADYYLDYSYEDTGYYDYDFFYDDFSEPLWPGAPPLP